MDLTSCCSFSWVIPMVADSQSHLLEMWGQTTIAFLSWGGQESLLDGLGREGARAQRKSVGVAVAAPGRGRGGVASGGGRGASRRPDFEHARNIEIRFAVLLLAAHSTSSTEHTLNIIFGVKNLCKPEDPSDFYDLRRTNLKS